MSKTVLVVGSGGREHTLAWKLAQSPQVKAVYVAPGNAGTQQDGKISNVGVSVADVPEWCLKNSIDLAVIGPEDPLAAGIADKLTEKGVPCFGPSAKASQLESSKEFSKSFMTKHGIPTARWESFTDSEKACHFINNADFPALVVKASGLAAGKGVIVAADKAEACQAAREMLNDGKFGAAGASIVVEELLDGEEVSCLALTDGCTVVPLPPSQDHKRLMDGDLGPNTGGMGAYCPVTKVSNQALEFIRKEILQKTIDGMREDGTAYKGVLYAGLMLTTDGPKVLEYNCRFGDPETQVILPVIKSDLYDLFYSCTDASLDRTTLELHENQVAVGIVAVSGGYPGSYKKGLEITGLDDVKNDLIVFHAGTKMADGKVLTSGGRVLAVVAVQQNVAAAIGSALQGIQKIQFEGKFYRKDIAHKALKPSPRQIGYSDAGVDIGAGDALVDRIKPHAKATSRLGCTADLGGFGGVFDLKAAGYVDPLLVSGTDGVGTKLKIAQSCPGHEACVGQDLVAMCVNDILCHGAEPLFFLDYFACGRLEVGVAAEVVKGVAKACQEVGCALLGGETAEMPGMYSGGDYDVAGFAVGAVERKDYLPRMDAIIEGDVLIGIGSNGLHSNGFSLVRRLVEESGMNFSDPCPYESEGKTLGSSLLTPTKLYVKPVLSAMKTGAVKAMSHITGGGLPGNVVRVLPDGFGAQLDANTWTMPPVFGWIGGMGNVAVSEMSRTFNCGLGMILVVAKEDVETVSKALKDDGENNVWTIGKINKCESGERVQVDNLGEALRRAAPPPSQAQMNGSVTKKRVAVLISGSGTNLQALIDDSQKPGRHSQIVLVISNKPDVQGLQRAQEAGIPTLVIRHTEYKDRAAFDGALHEALLAAGAEIVCLAGFMRILTGGFVSKWSGRMINIHPALLPSFKGAKAQQMALEARVTMTGCTVHYVVEEVDGGAILVQEAVPVLPDDNEDSLSERIRTKEHTAYPTALELIASGKANMGDDGKVVWKM